MAYFNLTKKQAQIAIEDYNELKRVVDACVAMGKPLKDISVIVNAHNVDEDEYTYCDVNCGSITATIVDYGNIEVRELFDVWDHWTLLCEQVTVKELTDFINKEV